MCVALDIIIPVYNEDKVICDTLNEVKTKITVENRILIVFDFDEDTTVPVVNQYVRENSGINIQLVKNSFGNGVLNAIRTGFEHADAEAVLVVMGDASDDLIAVEKMYQKIQEGYDIVCGSRYMSGGKQIGGQKFKKFLSRMAGLSLHLLTGIPTHDISNSFKLYRTSLVKSITVESTGGFEIGLEILVKAFLNGYKITEVPSIWKDRTAGESRFKLIKWLPCYLRWYLLAVKGKFLKLGVHRS